MKTNRISETQVHDCLRTIIKNQNEKSLNYAVNYAKAGFCQSGHDLKIQILYVLNNMVSWRGEEAKKVRQTLKQFIKENK